MLIRVINCKQLFTKNYVEEIKDRIKMYRQGFMIAGNELYLPLYQVLRACYTLPDDFSELLAVVDEIAQAQYETGYADAEE